MPYNEEKGYNEPAETSADLAKQTAEAEAAAAERARLEAEEAQKAADEAEAAQQAADEAASEG